MSPKLDDRYATHPLEFHLAPTRTDMPVLDDRVRDVFGLSPSSPYPHALAPLPTECPDNDADLTPLAPSQTGPVLDTDGPPFIDTVTSSAGVCCTTNTRPASPCGVARARVSLTPGCVLHQSHQRCRFPRYVLSSPPNMNWAVEDLHGPNVVRRPLDHDQLCTDVDDVKRSTREET